MVLVDTSVWVSHFKMGNEKLKELLREGQVYCHPFIIGELACGQFKHRKEIMHLLLDLPKATITEDKEVLSFIESHQLHGLGIGWVDAHLLASALLSKLFLWTFDKRLQLAASKLHLVYHL